MPRLRIYDDALCQYRNNGIVLNKISDDDIYQYALNFANYWQRVECEDEGVKENFQPSEQYPTFEEYLKQDKIELTINPIRWLKFREFSVIIDKLNPKSANQCHKYLAVPTVINNDIVID